MIFGYVKIRCTVVLYNLDIIISKTTLNTVPHASPNQIHRNAVLVKLPCEQPVAMTWKDQFLQMLFKHYIVYKVIQIVL